MMEKLTAFASYIASYIVTNFGFTSIADFINSMFHLKLFNYTMSTAIVGFAFISSCLGISSGILISFIIIAFAELITGLFASSVEKVTWTSRRFSRFGLKITCYLILFLVTNMLQVSYTEVDGIRNALLYNVFSSLHGVLILFVTLEYMISVLENLSRIFKKGDKRLINFLNRKIDDILVEDDDEKK